MSDLIDKDYVLQATLERTEKNVKDQTDIYSECVYYPDTYYCYEFQLKAVRRLGGKILNAACADDPCKFGEPPYNATNLDVQTFEKSSGNDFSKTKNFIHGTVFDMPFEDESYDTVVLGEFLEHCIVERAEQAIIECRRVLKPGGHLVMTIPLDARSREEQRGLWVVGGDVAIDPERPMEYCPGVTEYHQTWWSPQMLYELRKKTKMVEVGRAALFYLLTCPLSGYGLIWKKP